MSEKKVYHVELPPPPSPTKFALEREAFQLMLPELLKTHYGKYVAIHEGKIVAEGDTDVDVADEAHRRVGNVALYVSRVVRPTEQEVVRMPMFRVVREWRD